jgi:hypothetical protein
MRIILATVTLLVCFQIPLHAQFTVKDYKEMTKDENGKLLMKTYLMGVGEGIMIANIQVGNIQVGSEKKVKLYCPLDRLAINADNYVNILEAEIKLNSITQPAIVDTAPLSALLMAGLQRTFPCPVAK